jgi:tetratricopeptide (TPR) repeat protein
VNNPVRYISFDTYSIIGDHSNAVDYYQKSITILREEKDSINLASALYNLGNEFIKVDKLDSAMADTKESEAIFKNFSSQMGEGYSLGNIGVIYSKRDDDKMAEENLDKAVGLLEPLNEFSAICEFFVSIADIH